jgi:hypothetical protein
METENESDLFTKLDQDVQDLLKEYQDKGLNVVDQSLALILNAVCRMLYCAPTELEGIKDINDMINQGIMFYEDTHS